MRFSRVLHYSLQCLDDNGEGSVMTSTDMSERDYERVDKTELNWRVSCLSNTVYGSVVCRFGGYVTTSVCKAKLGCIKIL